MVHVLFYSKSAAIKPKGDPLYGHGLPPDARKLLSNFAPLSVQWRGKVYPSVEHAFQAAKYLYSHPKDAAAAVATQFQQRRTIGQQPAQKAKSAGTKTAMKKHHVQLDCSSWDRVKDEVMLELLQSKVSRHPVIQKILEVCHDNNLSLVHYSMRDDYWGAKIDKTTGRVVGRNKLGKMLMRIAEHLDAARGLVRMRHGQMRHGQMRHGQMRHDR